MRSPLRRDPLARWGHALTPRLLVLACVFAVLLALTPLLFGPVVEVVLCLLVIATWAGVYWVAIRPMRALALRTYPCMYPGCRAQVRGWDTFCSFHSFDARRAAYGRYDDDPDDERGA